MSKQLAISSSFATFALAAMALLYTPDHSGLTGGDPFMEMQADSAALSLHSPSLFRD